MKKILVVFVILGCLVGQSFAQNPGNVGTTNLSAWFKADGLSTGNVPTWTTSFPSGGSAITVSDANSPYPQAGASFNGAVMNYNNMIDFTGNTTGTLKVLENSSALDLLDNTGIGDQGSFFAVYHIPSNSPCSGCHVINYREATAGTVDGIQFRVKLGTNTGRLAIGSGGNSLNASRDFVQDFRPDIISYKGNRSGAITFSTYRRSQLFTGGGGSSTTGEQGLYVGGRLGGMSYDGLFEGMISELIFYNRDLSAQEFAKIHTYLALKYGITLNNIGGSTQGDYVAPDGSTLWDASAQPVYHNNIISISREDSEGLLQKQSHTFDDSTRIYVGSLAATNSMNTGNISADSAYIVMGHNNAALCPTGASNAEVPAGMGIYGRLEREWRLTNTNFSDEFNLNITAASCSGVILLSDLRLLVDADGNFTNATMYNAGAGLGFGLNGNEITVTGISNLHLPENTTRYFTIAMANPSTGIQANAEAGIFVFPNPANDKLTISYGITQSTTAIVYNSLGQIVMEKQIGANPNGNISFDISGFDTGVYVVRINSAHSIFIKE